MNYWVEEQLKLQEQLKQEMFNQIGISATRQGITNPCGETHLRGIGRETNIKLLLL